MTKKLFSLILIVFLIFTSMPVAEVLATDKSNYSVDDELSLEATNSFGSVMSDAMKEYGENEVDNGYGILDIESGDKQLAVDVKTIDACEMAVGIYDEKSNELLATETVSVPSGENCITVKFDTKVPEYYVARAVLIDESSNPVSSVYTDQTSTEWYSEFDNSESTDYDHDLVLNLTEDTRDNFVVFKDDVTFIDEKFNFEVNSIVDDNTIKYKVDSEAVENLQEGEVFCYNKNDAEKMIIGKATDISKKNGYYEVVADDVTVKDVFSIVKINYQEENCDLDYVEGGELIETEVDAPQAYSRSARALTKGSAESTKKVSFSFSLEKAMKKEGKWDSSSSVKGSLTGTISTSVKIEWNIFKLYFKTELSITPKAAISVTAEKSISKVFKLGEVGIPTTVPGLYIKVIFNFKLEAACELQLECSISQTKSVSWSTSNGVRNKSTAPVVDASFQVEGKIKIGFEINPVISLVGVVNLGLEGFVGVEVTASSKWSATSASTKHECASCVSGDLKGVISLSFTCNIKIAKWEKGVDLKITGDIKFKIFEFYWSISNKDFGIGECPHLLHKINFKIVDESGNVIKNAKIDGNATSNGTASLWYKDGTHEVIVKSSGYNTKRFRLGVSDPKTVVVKLKKGASDVEDVEVDSSFSTYTRRSASRRNGYSTYIAPLTFTEPYEGVVLSTALAYQRRSDVAWVQRELKNLGYNINADGYYGNATAAVVRQFQADYSLPITGKIVANDVAVIKKPLKNVESPVLQLNSSSSIESGGIVSLSWNAVSGASAYELYVYDSNGKSVYCDTDIKTNVAAFTLYEPGTYTIKAKSKNDRFISAVSELNTKIVVRDKLVVTFVDWDGTVLCKQFVEYGASAVTPASPERDGYTFNKWDTNYSKVNENITVTAMYNRNQYKVTFLNTDGKEISSDKYYFEQAAVFPDENVLTIPSGCKFIGWDKDVSCITEDIIVKPVVQYANDQLPIIIENCSVENDEGYGYNVTATVKNYDKRRTMGRVVVALKTADNQFISMTESSAFTLGKSDFSANDIKKESIEIFVPCTQEAAYIDVYVVAAYEDLIPISEAKRYTLAETEFEPDNSNISGYVDAELAGKQAILFIYKNGDAADFTNEFIGQCVIGENGYYSFDYKLREEPSVKTGDFTVVIGIEGAENTIYLDKIEAPKPVHTVTIKNFDGTILDTQSVVQGSSATLPEENPERVGYIFAGWDYSNSSIYEDLTITAIYVPKTYSVVFIDWTNKRFDMETYKYGEKLIAPDLSSLDDYNTIGWEGIAEGTVVTQNMVVTAKYEKKTYVVKFYDYEGNVVDEQVVPHGELAMEPTLDSDENHIFYDWDKDCSCPVTASLNVYPEFRYAEDAVAPIADVESGVYSDSFELTLSVDDANAEIYYSVDGSEDMRYTAPIRIDETSEITYYASSLGKNNSDGKNNMYIINKPGSETEWVFPVSVYYEDTLISEMVLPYNSHIKDWLNVTMDGYTLQGIYTDKELSNELSKDYLLTAPAMLYVEFAPVEYNVEFKDADGDVISSQKVEFMQSAIAPEINDIPAGYVFVGWDTDDYYCVNSDHKVNAIIQKEEDCVSIALDRETYNMMEGYSYSLVADVKNAPDSEIFWESDDESIAIVDGNGMVTAVSDGIAVITATILDKEIFATCYIEISKNPAMSIKANEDSKYTIVDDCLIGISPSSNTVNDVLNQIESENVKIYSNDDLIIDTEVVSTGDTIRLYDKFGECIDELTLVVVGDVNGDGNTGVADASFITRVLVGKESLIGCYLLAGDVNADGSVNNKDASVIMRYKVDKETI